MVLGTLRNGLVALFLLAIAGGTSALYLRLNADLVHFRIAEWLDHHGHAEDATDHLSRSVAAGLDQPERLRDASLALLHRGQTDLAFAASWRLHEAGALQPDLRAALAGHFDRLGEPTRALALYEVNDTLPPGAVMHHASLLRRTGQHAAAIEQYETLLERLPREADADAPSAADVRLAWAETHAWASEYEEAERVLQSLLDTEPGHRAAQLLRARVLAWSGRTDKAIEAYRHYLGDAP